MKIALSNKQASRIKQTLHMDIYNPTRSRGSDFSKVDDDEFQNIFQIVQENYDKEIIEIEFSERFLEIWMPLVFKESFKHTNNIRKGEAKEMAKLYMQLNNNEFPEEFLANYVKYYVDID